METCGQEQNIKSYKVGGCKNGKAEKQKLTRNLPSNLAYTRLHTVLLSSLENERLNFEVSQWLRQHGNFPRRE